MMSSKGNDFALLDPKIEVGDDYFDISRGVSLEDGLKGRDGNVLEIMLEDDFDSFSSGDNPVKQNNNGFKTTDKSVSTVQQEPRSHLKSKFIFKSSYDPPSVPYQTRQNIEEVIHGFAISGVNNVDKEPIRWKACNAEKILENSIGKQDLSKTYSGAQPNQCCQCGKLFTNRILLINHVNDTHPNVTLIYCGECGRTFSTQTGFSRHHSSAHKQSKSLLVGSFRSKPFKIGKLENSTKNNDVHQISGLGNSFDCAECGKPNFSKQALKKHFIEIHQCDFLKSGLTLHKNTHKEIHEFHCEKCGESFSQEISLTTHLMVVHKIIQSFQCEECEKTFSKRDALTSHVNVVHKSIKPFQCGECGRYFSQILYLERHKDSHNNSKQFQCEECGKCFSRKGYLKLHRNSHSVVKTFNCNGCDKCFSSVAALRYHSKIHNVAKSFQCQQCGKGFSRGSDLSRHNKLFHKNG